MFCVQNLFNNVPLFQISLGKCVVSRRMFSFNKAANFAQRGANFAQLHFSVLGSVFAINFKIVFAIMLILLYFVIFTDYIAFIRSIWHDNLIEYILLYISLCLYYNMCTLPINVYPHFHLNVKYIFAIL